MTASYKTTPNKTLNVNGQNMLYRELGPKGGVPVIMLHHLTAVLDDWDPAIIDELAKTRHVIAFDNKGVGGSEGTTPDNVEEMAKDAEAFIDAMKLEKVDLLGYSLGGFIAQVLSKNRPALIRKVVLAGTGPVGGDGIKNIGAVLQTAFQKAATEKKHPKHFLFFSPSEESQKSAAAFLERINQRTQDLDKAITNETIQAQVKAITVWGSQPSISLSDLSQDFLVVNGDHDIMIPTSNSFALQRQLKNVRLSIFPDSGHGAIFQYPGTFTNQVLSFLAE